MDQIQNKPLPEFLKPLLANPVAANLSDAAALETLVQSYPQCSIFHLLLAKAAQNGETEMAAKTLQSAAVHAANREVLFRLIHQPELITLPKRETVYPFVELPAEAEALNADASFMPEIAVSTEDKILSADKNTFTESYPVEIINTSFTKENSLEKEAVDLEEAFSEAAVDASFNNQNLLEEPTVKTEDATINLNPEEAIAAENDLRVEDVSLTFVNEADDEIVFPMEETIDQHQQPETSSNLETANASFNNEIDEEVYDEITAIEDIKFDTVKEAFAKESQTDLKPEKPAEEIPKLSVQDKAEKDMLSSIASIDYFTFNNKFGQNQTPAVLVQQQSPEVPEVKKTVADTAVIVAKPAEAPAQTEPETVSKYHDDKMPYTFMWWLDKTRKEYAGTYQPYVQNINTPRTNSELSVGPELNQQYIESIFHTKPPHGLAESTLTPVAAPTEKRKEDQLIERFIIEEPHIHPPSMDRLDTENKAKKSSEDGDVLVTETLAKIYMDQMLYHKALDTYKKLLLKFPEKSRYFTSQIELIEKKIN